MNSSGTDGLKKGSGDTRNSDSVQSADAVQDRRFLEHALRLAREAQEAGSSPVGAVLVDAAGKVLAEGQNRTGEKFGPERVGGASLNQSPALAR